MARPQGDPLEFSVDEVVRYKPGVGTYGYDDAIEADGRIPARVIGHSRSRVKITFAVTEYGITRSISRGVDAASLQRSQPA